MYSERGDDESGEEDGKRDLIIESKRTVITVLFFLF